MRKLTAIFTILFIGSTVCLIYMISADLADFWNKISPVLPGYLGSILLVTYLNRNSFQRETLEKIIFGVGMLSAIWTCVIINFR